jgi:riboflavin synthase
MFTGLVEGQGEVVGLERKKDQAHLSVKPEFPWEEKKIGESISVNGVCLTADEWKGGIFAAHVSSETLSRTNLGRLQIGDRVNLERALRLSDRLGGHLVTGHIDGTGKIIRKEPFQGFFRMTIAFPKELGPYIIEKGSIAVDGVSLTVNGVEGHTLELMLIPHTAGRTTLAWKKAGDEVNLETDLIGKYVVQTLSRRGHPPEGRSKVNEDFLKEHGFL